MRNINEIIIHCTATPEGKEFSVDKIRQWHKRRGFDDIGYHYVIHLDGTVEPARPIETQGAHCYGHNEHSVGIAYVGGLTANGKACKNTLTPEQEASLILLCRQLAERYPEIRRVGKVSTLAQSERSSQACLDNAEPKQGHEHECLLNIHGHNEFSLKRCPCFDVQEERIKWGI